MNAARRKALAEITARLDEIKDLASNLLADAESIRDEEQESFDNLPEGLQQSDRGQASEAAVQSLEDAINALETIGDSADEAQSSLEAASE